MGAAGISIEHLGKISRVDRRESRHAPGIGRDAGSRYGVDCLFCTHLRFVKSCRAISGDVHRHFISRRHVHICHHAVSRGCVGVCRHIIVSLHVAVRRHVVASLSVVGRRHVVAGLGVVGRRNVVAVRLRLIHSCRVVAGLGVVICRHIIARQNVIRRCHVVVRLGIVRRHRIIGVRVVHVGVDAHRLGLGAGEVIGHAVSSDVRVGLHGHTELRMGDVNAVVLSAFLPIVLRLGCHGHLVIGDLHCIAPDIPVKSGVDLGLVHLVRSKVGLGQSIIPGVCRRFHGVLHLGRCDRLALSRLPGSALRRAFARPFLKIGSGGRFICLILAEQIEVQIRPGAGLSRGLTVEHGQVIVGAILAQAVGIQLPQELLHLRGLIIDILVGRAVRAAAHQRLQLILRRLCVLHRLLARPLDLSGTDDHRRAVLRRLIDRPADRLEGQVVAVVFLPHRSAPNELLLQIQFSLRLGAQSQAVSLFDLTYVVLELVTDIIHPVQIQAHREESGILVRRQQS